VVSVLLSSCVYVVVYMNVLIYPKQALTEERLFLCFSFFNPTNLTLTSLGCSERLNLPQTRTHTHNFNTFTITK
jgi:hypothetical protein